MNKNKSGLKIREVSTDPRFSWCNGINKNESTFSRLVLRLIEAKNLLASDLETGKSDPVCFAWCGPKSATTVTLVEDIDESNFIKSDVCPSTCDPQWNQDLVFPIDITDINALNDLVCKIYVKDQDFNDDGTIKYDELGMIDMDFKNIIQNGKVLTNKNSIVLKPQFYALQKSPGMKKVDGLIKLSFSLIIGENDYSSVLNQINNNNNNNNSDNVPTSSSSKQKTGITLLLQEKLNCDNKNKQNSLLNSSTSNRRSLSQSPSRKLNTFGAVAIAKRPVSATSRIEKSNSKNDVTVADNNSMDNSVDPSMPIPLSTRGRQKSSNWKQIETKNKNADFNNYGHELDDLLEDNNENNDDTFDNDNNVEKNVENKIENDIENDNNEETYLKHDENVNIHINKNDDEEKDEEVHMIPYTGDMFLNDDNNNDDDNIDNENDENNKNDHENLINELQQQEETQKNKNFEQKTKYY